MKQETSHVRRPFILDMETQDPDDFLTLVLLLGHPDVNLIAVTITPGSLEQIHLVKQALTLFGRGDDAGDAAVRIGSYQFAQLSKVTTPQESDEGPASGHGGGGSVSGWHFKAYQGIFSPLNQTSLSDPTKLQVLLTNVDEGWKVLDKYFLPGVTMVEGAAPKNLGQLLANSPRLQHVKSSDVPLLGSLFFQGGFAGEGVVPSSKQLDKFKGMDAVPSFNPGGDHQSTLHILRSQYRHTSAHDRSAHGGGVFEALTFVSKNVCHGVKYDLPMHQAFQQHLTSVGSSLRLGEMSPKNSEPEVVVDGVIAYALKTPPAENSLLPPALLAQSIIYHGMSTYLKKQTNRHHQQHGSTGHGHGATKPESEGKALHDPLAACCAVNVAIGDWAEIEMHYQRGKWKSVLAPGSGVSIIVDYRPDVFLATMLQIAPSVSGCSPSSRNQSKLVIEDASASKSDSSGQGPLQRQPVGGTVDTVGHKKKKRLQ